MKRAAVDAVWLPALLTVALVVMVLVVPGRRELIVHVYALAVAAILLLHLVRAVRAAQPAAGASRFDAALRRRTRPQERVPELERVEREIALATATAFDVHYRLRPTLRGIAGELLAARRGVHLDEDPDAARRVLGEDTWEIVRADRQPPRDRAAAGIDLRSLDSVVASLEAL